MGKHFFLREALRSFKSTGAIASSSPALIKKLIEPIPAGRDLVIVELGPGDGCVTKQLLRKLGVEAQVYAFEINESFISIMREIKDDRLKVIPHGAERMSDFLMAESVDYVVSSLPLSMIPKEIKEEILRQAQQVLKPNGRFLQYQYALQDYNLLKDYFYNVNVKFTLANLPPAFIYTCSLGLGVG